MMVRKELTDRARDFNIILDDVSITELSFGKEYTAAVEAKQVAQQEAQRAAFVVERAKQERQQKIVQAEGEAEAARMISFYECVYLLASISQNFMFKPKLLSKNIGPVCLFLGTAVILMVPNFFLHPYEKNTIIIPVYNVYLNIAFLTT